MEAFELNAETRKTTGSAESRRLRRRGRVPAIIYGGNDEPTMVSFDHDDLDHHLSNEAFYSHIIKINVSDGSPQEAVLRDLQRHPARPFVEHADFLRVVAGETLRMSVPLHFMGEEECPGVKTEEGIIQRVMNEVEIECLPRDLPEYIEVDVSALHVNDSVHLSELTLPDGVEIVELMHAEEGDEESPVVSVQLPRAAVEDEIEEEAAAAAEDEATAEGEETAEAGDAEEGESEGEDDDSEA